MKTIFKSILLLSIITFLSCEDDDARRNPLPQPEGEYTDGFFVVNEGNFDGSGELTFISDDFLRVEQGVFSTVNDGESIGLFPQSIFFDDNQRAYIIANGSNVITVVNRFTLEKITEIQNNLDIPRYGVVLDGKAYVTNQGSFMTNADDFVTVINLSDFSVETTIPLLDTAEFIITDGNSIFVQNAAFGMGNQISVINPDTNSIDATIDTGESLQNIDINANLLYALNSNGVEVFSLNNLEMTSTLTIPTGLSGLRNFRLFEGQMYYTDNNSVYKTALSASTLSDEKLIEFSSTSFGKFYGFEVNDNKIYITDAVDFNSNGFIEVYSSNGDLLFETSVGLSPNGFYFN